MSKIQMSPIVEIDGDEMTRVIWRMVKEEVIAPNVDLNTEYYDLSIQERDRTADQVTADAANAIKRLGVGVKCATITHNAARLKEFGFTKMYPSPNATIRGILDGTVFRAPITADNVRPYVRTWKKPITVARHAYADVYMAQERRVGGVIMQNMFNTEASITAFARACFSYALQAGQDLWFSAKDTISKIYDGAFRDIFAEIYAAEFKPKFEAAGLKYFYTLIDDAVARVLRSEGGFVWALKNYDGDVMSDMVSTAFGSLAMMTSVLCSPPADANTGAGGCFEYEAAHGTITAHYRRYSEGAPATANPMATLFAWTGALKKRGELDGNKPLADFAAKTERAAIATIESGVMTVDLADLCEGDVKTVDTLGFLRALTNSAAFS